MNFFQAVIYGLIQGLTEFFPVSSSAHLAVLPHFFNIQDPGLLFDLSMHGGTVFAVMVYFRKDIRELFDRRKRPYLYNLGIATVATVLLVLIINKSSFAYGRAPKLIALNLVIFGILMVVADLFGRKNQGPSLERLSPFKAALIGFFQGIAVFPGVSRSGSTLTIARWLGLSREEAARFSFLLSIPAIVGGIVFKLPEFVKGDLAFQWIPCLVGVLIAFVIGLLAIHFFLKILLAKGLVPFCLYRIALAVLIIKLM